MMKPNELYREGKLREAIKALGEELRSNPTDAKRRTFLFELLLFAGEYDRAEKQLDVLAALNADSAAGALLYRSALHAERMRQQMFAANDLPLASTAVDQTTPKNGRYSGRCNDLSFEEMYDADPRIGANLEAFIAGSYTWIPFRYLNRIEIKPPTTLRDLIWTRARIEATPDFRLQELGEVLLPVISPLSYRHDEESVQLGRETHWQLNQSDEEIPYGSKMWVIDGKDIPMLNIRSVEWSSPTNEDLGATDADQVRKGIKAEGSNHASS